MDKNFVENVAELQTKFIDDVIALADKYGEDRDDVMEYAAAIFNLVAETSTFKKYVVGGN